jgi:hypothetical protein
VAKRKKKIKMSATTKPKSKKNKDNYIDNQKMYQEMVDYTEKISEYNKKIKKLPDNEPTPPKPRVSEYIGSCIIMIAQRLATKPNFANYVHREEMIGDGIENCLMYIDNFDPKKSKNPFAYFTQIIYFAFVRRIQKEKKQMYVKMKMMEHLDEKGVIRKIIKEQNLLSEKNTNDNLYANFFNLKESDIKTFEKNSAGKTKKKSKKSNLDDYFI